MTPGWNTAATLGLSLTGERLDPYMGFNFLVEIDGLLCGGFTRVHGLEGSIAVEERPEGGVNGYVEKFLKGGSFPNLVLTQGLTDLDALWGWFDRTRQGVIRRKSGTIMLLDPRRLPVMWWDFRDAIPVKWIGPTLDASQGDQVAVQVIELAHRGLTKSLASAALSAARAGASLSK